MASEPIVVREWDYIYLELEKTESLLSSHGDSFKSFFRRGSLQAQATSHVGTVVFEDGTMIEVLPKVGRTDGEAIFPILLYELLQVYLY